MRPFGKKKQEQGAAMQGSVLFATATFYSRYITAWGAVSAIGAGTLVTPAWDIRAVKDCFPHILADRDVIFPALFVAVAAMIAISLFTPKPAPEQLAQFADWSWLRRKMLPVEWIGLTLSV